MTMLLGTNDAATTQRPKQGNPAGDRDLLYYVEFLGRNWMTLTVSLIIAAVFGTALFLNSTPQYQARTDVVVVAISDLTLEGKKVSDVSIDSAVQVLLSDQVLGETARALKYPNRSSGLIADLDISPLINSRILRVSVSSPTPELAYNAVTLLTENFLTARLKSLQNNEGARAATLKTQLAQVGVSLEAARNGPTKTGTEIKETMRLLTEQQSTLQTELTAISISVAEPGYISHKAELPTVSSRPRGMIYVGSSLAVGLLVGCFTASLLNQRNPRHRAISSPHLRRPS